MGWFKLVGRVKGEYSFLADGKTEMNRKSMLCRYGKISAHAGKEVSDSVHERQLAAHHQEGVPHSLILQGSRAAQIVP